MLTGSSFILSGFRKAQGQGLSKKEKNFPISTQLLFKQNTRESPSNSAPTIENYLPITYIAESQQNLESILVDNPSMFDSKDLFMKDDQGQLHRLVGNPGHKALTCVYCKMMGNKTACGWHIKCYYRCSVCDVPLCNIKRDCFIQYHNKLKMQQARPLTYELT